MSIPPKSGGSRSGSRNGAGRSRRPHASRSASDNSSTTGPKPGHPYARRDAARAESATGERTTGERATGERSGRDAVPVQRRARRAAEEPRVDWYENENGRGSRGKKTDRPDRPEPRDNVRGDKRPASGTAGPRKPLSARPARKATPETPIAPARPATPAGGAMARSRSAPDLGPRPAPRFPKRASVAATATKAREGEPREGERIAKLLARAGVASRREVERMIEEGRVSLDGEVLTTPATVLPNLRGVTVDGRAIAAPAPARLFRFHKPDGLITAERDPAGRPTIYNALRNALPPGTPRVMPVGRLDLNTEGLLLLTTDGELKRALELPATGIPRTYRARTFGDISQDQLETLIEGIEIDGVRYGPIDANMERRTGRNQWIEVTLTEGKNREVRRVLEHLGLQVSRLLRVAYGPFLLADLPRGAAHEVPQVDVERFVKSLKKREG